MYSKSLNSLRFVAKDLNHDPMNRMAAVSTELQNLASLQATVVEERPLCNQMKKHVYHFQNLNPKCLSKKMFFYFVASLASKCIHVSEEIICYICSDKLNPLIGLRQLINL